MHTLAVKQWPLPGDAGFPLNAMYQKPSDRSDEGQFWLGCLYIIAELRDFPNSYLFCRQYAEVHAAIETRNGNPCL